VTLVTDGEVLAALFLLSLRIAILSAFVAFFVHLRRRAVLDADRELDREWFELQRASRNAWRRAHLDGSCLIPRTDRTTGGIP